jgi:hypothetical protein
LINSFIELVTRKDKLASQLYLLLLSLHYSEREGEALPKLLVRRQCPEPHWVIYLLILTQLRRHVVGVP